MSSPYSMASPCYSSDDDGRGTPDRVFKEPEYPVVIVDQKYCSTYPVQLVFEKNHDSEDKFKISDDDGNVIFKAKKKKNGFREMVDESDTTIISFTTKVVSLISYVVSLRDYMEISKMNGWLTYDFFFFHF
ncbi:putative tubby-like protein [Helianthus anomalus]